jgi:hypothetical protein
MTTIVFHNGPFVGDRDGGQDGRSYSRLLSMLAGHDHMASRAGIMMEPHPSTVTAATMAR